ncbi:flagellar biosynthesis anti-sigma factor FlgM [Chitinibacter bivalviorum]|uniref:Negative regulator of flagellin synthesis n=1 Tax=Chitinibacter bivalviorum TaxID=2739434 RepID=A0A7H9BHX3_9NEIS|nr:flagellar biosynthesis anti-sigma factor FlgM [Chitinibacter bivalviorum]QLG87144.1 flagellar biosynthesis anti-sigma factor FlgM [Chitinibacter bivalviorum]
MKIDNSGKPLASLASKTAEVRSNASAKTDAATPVESSSVNSKLSGVASNEASFDAEKVAAIRSAIAEGRFAVKPEAIADGLLSSVKELLAR